MTKQVHTVGPDQTLKECAEILKKYHVNGLVVVEGGTVKGVITKADLFKAILPSYSDIMEDEHHIASFEYIEERAHKLYDLTVRTIMGTPPYHHNERHAHSEGRLSYDLEEGKTASGR